MYVTQWKQAIPMPLGLIGRSRNFFRNMILYTLSLINQQPESNFLRCLYCHNVFDDQKETFEYLLLELKRYGTFVDTDTCVQMVKGEKNIDARYYHLSFDDGFRGDFTNAFPILKKHNIPSIFFVPSFLISANWDRAKAYCLGVTGYKDVIEMLKWEDLADMIASGYEIGSHTRIHSRLSSLSHDTMLLEDAILGSKKELELHLGIECKYISWPYGQETDIDKISSTVIRNARYQGCFSAIRGSIIPQMTDVFSIPRHHFEVHWPIAHVKYFAGGNMETL